MDSIQTVDLFGSGRFTDSMEGAGAGPPQDNPARGQEGKSRIVEVWGVDDELLVEMCGYYFENPAEGGGDIVRSHWDMLKKALFITFADAAVAERIATKRHDVGGHLLGVTLKERSSTVKVTGVDPEMKALYTLYFKSPKRGGGPIVDLKVDDQFPAIFITFENPEVAEAVCSRSHRVGGRQLQVTLHVPQRDPIGPEEEPTRTVVVIGADPDMVELYELYFENPRNGGGQVEEVNIDKDKSAIYITFTDAKVAEAVCSRSHRVAGRELQVTLHVRQRYLREQRSLEKTSVTGEEEEAPTRTVVVTCDGELQTDDTYLYYFENPRNGGGEVKDVKIDNDKRAVYITFSEPKVAEAVANRAHTLFGQRVQVRLYVPPKPEPAYPDKLLFHNVGPHTTKDCLAMYLERITGIEAEDILYGDEPGVVLVTFATGPDFAKVQGQCRERKLEKRQLRVSRVPVSNCLLVEGLDPTTTEDTLMMYFENSRRSGGGPVECMEIKRDNFMYRAFVYFEDHEVIGRVLQKTHKIDGRSVQVKCYMECLGPSGGRQDPSTPTRRQ